MFGTNPQTAQACATVGIAQVKPIKDPPIGIGASYRLRHMVGKSLSEDNDLPHEQEWHHDSSTHG